MVDYRANAPLHTYLSKHYSNPCFDSVIDAYGVPELYSNCADFLAEDKPFVTVGIAMNEYTVASIIHSTSLMLKNRFWPHVLGGPPRDYLCVTALTNTEDMEKLRTLCEEGKLKVVVDSCWEMVDALKVSLEKSCIFFEIVTCLSTGL